MRKRAWTLIISALICACPGAPNWNAREQKDNASTAHAILVSKLCCTRGIVSPLPARWRRRLAARPWFVGRDRDKAVTVFARSKTLQRCAALSLSQNLLEALARVFEKVPSGPCNHRSPRGAFTLPITPETLPGIQ